ncbi:MAG: hypothetical protein C0394_06420 [Syntrophus sp. (in: bacteria)]|nr:hypothetical protein [Syntrophus sp. (in: bacteria)]
MPQPPGRSPDVLHSPVHDRLLHWIFLKISRCGLYRRDKGEKITSAVEIKSRLQIQSDDRPFPISYSTARALVRRLGEKVNVRISPHDLRRYSATYASRNGVPLEVVSKVILRHQDLKTTQVYLGKINDTEAIRWMDILHGK